MSNSLFQDHEGNNSSFRVLWAFCVIIIVLTWAYTTVTTSVIAEWPLDALTSIGLFVSPSIKTFTDRTNYNKTDG